MVFVQPPASSNQFANLYDVNVPALVASWGIPISLLDRGMAILSDWDDSDHWDHRLLVGKILALALEAGPERLQPEASDAREATTRPPQQS